MKQLFIMLVLFATTLSANAKIIVIKSVDDKIIAAKPHNQFRNTTLDLNGHNILFRGLPKNTLDIYVIDATGKVALSGTISRKNNTLDMTRLSKGAYTIALKQGESIKLFGWLAEVVVNGICRK